VGLNTLFRESHLPTFSAQLNAISLCIVDKLIPETGHRLNGFPVIVAGLSEEGREVIAPRQHIMAGKSRCVGYARV
jgi:hypothetical protein